MATRSISNDSNTKKPSNRIMSGDEEQGAEGAATMEPDEFASTEMGSRSTPSSNHDSTNEKKSSQGMTGLYIFLGVFVIGLVVSGLAFLITGINGVKQDEEQDFQRNADELSKSIEFTWKEFAITTLWMHETCHGIADDVARGFAAAASMGCTRNEFSTFFDYITSGGLEFEAVAFYANITQQERAAVEKESEEYYNTDFPDINYTGFVDTYFDANTGMFATRPRPEEPWYFIQHYILPLDPVNVLFLDLDVHPSTFIWPMMEAAIRDTKPIVSPPLPKQNELSKFVQLYNPGIERRDDPTFNSIAMAMVNVYNLLARAARTKNVNLKVYLFDKPSTETAELLFLSGAQLGADGPSTSRILPEIDFYNATASATHTFLKELAIEDRVWLVVITNDSDISKSDMLAPIVGGVVIMCASVMIAVWFCSSIRRAAKLQRIQVAAEVEKAALMEVVNRDLNQQVELRVQELRKTERMAELMVNEAKQAEMKSEFMMQTMSMLSHELRTPLQGIMGVTSLVLSDTLGYRDEGPGMPDCSRGPTSTFSTTSTTSETVSLATFSDSSYKDSVTECLDMIQVSSQQLLTLINNLLDVRKINSGLMETVQMECIDVGQIIQRCVNSLKPLANISNMTLCIGSQVLSGRVENRLAMGAVLPVEQVLINLVGNAIKYSSVSLISCGGPSSLSINVRNCTLADARREALEALCSSADKAGAEVGQEMSDRCALIVDVRDRGNGIPEDEAEKVFAEFKMLKQHTGQSKGFAQPTGSGLGLQLCSNLLGMMNGALVWANNCDSPKAAAALAAAEAERSDVAGCVFSFYLQKPSHDEIEEYLKTYEDPLHRDFVSSAPVNSIHITTPIIGSHPFKPSCERIPYQLHKVKVLVVDDTVVNVKVITKMLEKLGFQMIRTANSGTRAIEMLSSDPGCDIIFTDFQMPMMNGMELSVAARRLYSDLNLPLPFIVLCTADYSATLSTEIMEAGIQALLRKPITIQELSDFVEENRMVNDCGVIHKLIDL